MSVKVSIFKIFFVAAITFTIIIILTIFYYSASYHQKREHMLCETNYQLLLESCRDILNRSEKRELEPGTYSFKSKSKLVKSALDFNFPQIIRDIKPVFIKISNEGYVLLEIGGIPYEGIVAYSDNTPKGYSGDVELIPGLWYYNEDYRDEYPKHKKAIDKLIQKGRMRQGKNAVGRY